MSNICKKVLVVGLGSIGKRHVRIIGELYDEVKIIVLRHSQCEQTDVDEYSLYDCVTTIDEALELKPDAAIISNPATKHLDVAIILAEAGVHLLIEKPIAATSYGVQSLIDLCCRRDIALLAAYNLRFLPSLINFRQNIQQSRIGKVFSVHAEVGQYLPSWRPDSDYRKTVSAQKNLGGGVLLELSHEIDYLSWVFGSIGWVKSHVSKLSNLDIDVEDSVNMIFGVQESDVVISLNMDFIRHDSVRKCTVIGEKGSLCWDAISGDVSLFLEGEKEWSTIFSNQVERDYTYTEEIKHFFSVIKDNESPLVSGDDGLKVIQVIEAIHESNTNGKMVTIQ